MFTKDQFKIFEEQLLIQHDLLNALLIGCDTQILELTKLKSLYGQLEEAIKEVKEASHKYLFWVADTNSYAIAAPFPIVWMSLGYGFRHAWLYPIAVALGEGLFVIHFGWKMKQVRCALRYYTLSITTIIPLITILITVNNYSDREFTSSIGRLCFILVCVGWMFIQRRRIAFERAKQRRAEMLAQRARNTEEQMLSPSQLNEVAAEVDNKILDLDTISAKSLQLVRSILTLMALLSVILLWSELHSAFSFLENITLWDSASTVKGIDNLQPITLNSIFIVILVLIITTQMVRNLPALLELALLQHLNLTPGTGYAITTLTKYGLILLGGLIGFSIIGMEWSKFQWLAAALGVGLGFGLQEIFANFVSGLIILFEKPIRIGDTVTIRNLTGSITKINTRATTITDWDRKEIIVPNKAFITEQFVNWSLSDTVTRVVLHVPAPAESNIEKISNILVQAAIRCPLVLDFPIPEAFLVDIQKGLPLFELRIYAAEMSHRMPLRH
uniref:Mechanosensitive ion channel inner membrane domain-containing protein n=1 Tax=Glossina pallidipes TaxID=7398 RepID=A0A1A9Z1D4_GLOPL